MNLHYSQTTENGCPEDERFDYHMNLHYSQTQQETIVQDAQFDYHMNLHYSQTIVNSYQLTMCLTII